MRLSRKYPVPRDLALLYEFVNSLDLRRFVENGTPHIGGDELATLPQLELWMRRRGLLNEDVHLDGSAYRTSLALRDALRAVIGLAPSERRDGAGSAASRLNSLAVNFPLIVQVSRTGQFHLQPVPGIRFGGLGAILAEVQHAAETARLDRLKMCASEECRWVFYDRSKPGTRRWCTSTLCGNRQKTRAYRTRQRAASTAKQANQSA